jgi:hypothetical protein
MVVHSFFVGLCGGFLCRFRLALFAKLACFVSCSPPPPTFLPAHMVPTADVLAALAALVPSESSGGPVPTISIGDVEKLHARGVQLRIDQPWTVTFSGSENGEQGMGLPFCFVCGCVLQLPDMFQGGTVS